MFFLLFSILLNQPLSFNKCTVEISKTLFNLNTIEYQSYQNIFLSLCSNFNLSEFQFTQNDNYTIDPIAIYCQNPNEKKQCVPLINKNDLQFQFTNDLQITAKSNFDPITNNLTSFILNISLYPERISNSSLYDLTTDNDSIYFSFTDRSIYKSYVYNTNSNPKIPYKIQSYFSTRNFVDDNYILRMNLKSLNSKNPNGSMFQIDNETILIFKPIGFLGCPDGFNCTETTASSWICFTSNNTCEKLGTINEFPIIRYPKGATPNGIIEIVHSNDFVLNIACNRESTSSDVDWKEFIYNDKKEIKGIRGESPLICPIYEPIQDSYEDCIFCGAEDNIGNLIFDTYKMISDQSVEYMESLNYNGKSYTLQGNPCRYSKCPYYDNGTCFGDEDCKFWFCSQETSTEGKMTKQCVCYGSSMTNSTFMGILNEGTKNEEFIINYPNRFDQKMLIHYSYDKSPEKKFEIKQIESIEGISEKNLSIDPLQMEVTIHAESYYAKNQTNIIPIPSPCPMSIHTYSNMTDLVFIDKGDEYYTFHSSLLKEETIIDYSSQSFYKCYPSTLKVAISIYDTIPCPFPDYQCPNDQLNKANIWACYETEDKIKYCHPIGSKYIGFKITSDDDEIQFTYQGLYNTSTMLHMKCQKDRLNAEDFSQNYDININELTGEQNYHFYLQNQNLCLRSFSHEAIPEVQPTPYPQNMKIDLTAHKEINDSTMISADLKEIKPFYDMTFYMKNNYGYEKVGISMSISSLLTCPNNRQCDQFRWGNIWKIGKHYSMPIADYRYGVNVSFEKAQNVRVIESKPVTTSSGSIGASKHIKDQPENDYDVFAVFGGGINGAVSKIDIICDYGVDNIEFDKIIFQSSDQNEYYFTAYSKHACPKIKSDTTPSRSPYIYHKDENPDANKSHFSYTAIALIIVSGVILLAVAVGIAYNFVTKKLQPTSIEDQSDQKNEKKGELEGDEENPDKSKSKNTQKP